MPKSSYIVDTDDLYKRWSKRYKPLFSYLEMDSGLNRIISEEEDFKSLNKRIIHENALGRIDEVFMRDLKKRADIGRKGRSKFIKVFYQGVLKTKGWVHFKTSSQYNKGKHYYQYIKLLDIKDLKYLKGYKKRDIMRLLLSGNVSCYCSCLKSDTKIKLLDGRVVSVKDMEEEFKDGKELWVYSTDSKGDFKPGKVEKVWITGTTKRYIKVTLDNGKEIFTTEEHPYMLRDGSYLRADKLEVGQSLMPLYFNYTKGYENVKFNSDGLYRSVYKTVSSEVFSDDFVAEVKRRDEEDTLAIHHIDYNKLNNYPNNLKLMGVKAHYKFHANFIRDRWAKDRIFREKLHKASVRNAYKRNANPTEAMIRSRKKFIEKGHEFWRTKEGRKIKSICMSKTIKEFWNTMSVEERKAHIENHYSKTSEGRAQRSESMKSYWDNLDENVRKERNMKTGLILNEGLREKFKSKEFCEYFSNKVVEGKKHMCKKVLDYLVLEGLPLTEENYCKYKGKTYPKVSTYFNSFEDMLEYFNMRGNHKVSKIEVVDLTEEEPVYDIKVDKWENFYVDAGVVLHNCPDFLYKGFKYMGHKQGYGVYKENRYPKIRNPRLEGTVCKHLLAIFDVFMIHWTSISKDMFRSYYWKRRYKDDEE